VLAFVCDCLDALIHTSLLSGERTGLSAQMRVHTAYVISGMTRGLTTRFGSQKVPFAEGTVVDTFMTCQAVVATYVQTALYAEKVASTTL